MLRTTRPGSAIGVLAIGAALTLTAACGSSSGTDASAAATNVPTSGASSGAPSDQPTQATVTVAVQAITDFAPIWVGQKQGIFAAHGLTLTLKPGGASSAAQVPLLLNGQADVAATTATAAIQAAQQGLGIQIVGGLTDFATQDSEDSTAVVVAKGSPLKSLADLPGHTVALSGLKSVTQAAIVEAVRQQGGDPSTVEFIQAPLTTIGSLVASGKVDAGFLIDPLLTPALAQGLQVLGRPFPLVGPGLPATSLVSSTKYASAHPQVIAQLKAALAEAVSYATAHPDAVKSATAANSKIPAELVNASILPPFDASVTEAKVKQEVKLLQDANVLSGSVDVAALVGS